MKKEIYERLKALRLMQEIENDYINHEISMGDLKDPFNNEYKNLKEELIYLLVIEQGKRELAQDTEEENTIDMEKLKNNKHPDNYTTEEQQRHYYTKS